MQRQKTMLVTGAADGTGFAIAARFAKEGWRVLVTSRDVRRAQAAAERIMQQYGTPAFGYALDGVDVQQVAALFEQLDRQDLCPDTVVLNAANLGIGMDPLTVSAEDFMAVLQTNVGWNFAIVQQAARRMKQAGGGAVVFINSNTAYRAIPARCAYSASKSGVLGLARALELDLGKYHIRVNCVLPGMIKTSRWEENANDIQHAPSRYTPLGDIAEFEDIANAAWFLGSDQARNTTGAELTVDGGNMIQLYPIIPQQS